jgi:hypothetical protein
MPAIHLPRLRRQAAELAEKYDRPMVFMQELKDLFEFYGDRSRRPSQTGAPPPLIKAYKVPDPVLRRIFLEMAPLVEAEPEKAFALVEILWAEPVFELRLVAGQLLGRIPSSEQERLIEVLEKWVEENEEEGLLENMATQSLACLRSENPEAFTSQIEKWLGSKVIKHQKLGLRALLAQLIETEFENLPVVYRLLLMHIPNAPRGLRPYLLDLVKPLARRSPLETVYFLRQCLASSDNPAIPWLIRRSMELFPKDVQDSLKAALKGE